MSERTTIKSLDASVDQQSSELSSLRASKDLGSKPANLDSASSTSADLSQSSITTPGIELLRSARPETRIIRQGDGTGLTPEAEKGKAPAARRSKSPEIGIFKNAYYPYTGNVINRFVALIANICKVLERLILKLLGGGDVPLTKPSQQQSTPAAKQQSPTEEAAKKREAEQKQQRNLRTHRS